MVDRRAILAGATTLAGAAVLATTAAAQKSGTERSGKKRSFMIHLVVGVDMVNETDGAADNVRKHLEEELRKTIEGFSLRTVSGVRVTALKVAEIRE